MAEYNQEHLKKRLELGVRKKILFPDSELAREIERDYDRELTEIKVMPRKEYMFHSATLIYDGKVSLFTYRERTAIGILIEDEEIYNFHKYIFDVIWDSC